MSFAEYIQAQARHIAQIAGLPVFTGLVTPLDDLYRFSLDLVPPDSKPHFGRFLLVCHKAFMSAASTIARGQPDDSQGVTRRACEAARLARAMKHKPDNLETWHAYEERLARWQAREQNQRPKPLRPEIEDPPDNKFVQQLLGKAGMYSDASVHFTPEFIGTQAWRTEPKIETVSVKLQYCEPSQEEIEQALVDLCAMHVLILRVFDECYDNTFTKAEQWARRLNRVSEAGLSFIRPSK
jgi:hypothetical protein